MTRAKWRAATFLAGLLAAASLLAVLAPRASASDGQFWLKCGFASHAPDDPIVYPGEPGAAHLHAFLGNVSTDAFSTYASLRAADTTCRLAADTAAYWVPALLSPSGSPAPVVNVAVYYRGPAGQTSAPPADLKMLAGPNGASKPWFSCVGPGGGKFDLIPDCGDANVKANVLFPECWDGEHLDSVDHRSHVAYASGGACPASHPVRMTRLALHVTYDTQPGVAYHLSSDHQVPQAPSNDEPGESLHADFWNAWDQDALEQLVAFCVNQDQPCKDLTAMP